MACILELRGNADADLQEVLREGVRQLVGVLASHNRTLPATRQFVLTVPWPRRFLLARRPDLAEGILQVALRCIARFHRRATGRRTLRPGVIPDPEYSD